MIESDRYSRVKAEIFLDNIKKNLDIMHESISDSCRGIIGVIKTDAYGHGAVKCASVLEKVDYVKGFAVATAEEALEIREAGLKKPILILGFVFPYAYGQLIKDGVRLAVFKEDMLKEISNVAAKTGKKALIHIKLDTGMGRIGILPDDNGIEFVKKALSYDNIEVEGIFSHFARADETDKSAAYKQLERFNGFVKRVEDELSYKFPVKHISNSASILELKDAHLDIVRAGITLYGLSPSDEVTASDHGLFPVMDLKSHIVFIKEVEAGTTISYGGTYTADGRRRIATIPVGYGDGYPRSLSNKGYVLIRGKRAPIVGRVCMDQFMVDVTDIPDAREYDEVVLVGTQGNECLSAEEVGELSGRFNYELVCDIGARVPRVYIEK